MANRPGSLVNHGAQRINQKHISASESGLTDEDPHRQRDCDEVDGRSGSRK